MTSVFSHFTALRFGQQYKLTTKPVWIELSLLAPVCEVINGITPSLGLLKSYSTQRMCNLKTVLNNQRRRKEEESNPGKLKSNAASETFIVVSGNFRTGNSRISQL